jgi:ABC-2 type transport system ATP-binding protein
MMKTVLSCRDLRQRYGDTVALDGINADACAGDVIGLIGLNGAGKTTLLETVLGFSPPWSGTVALFDRGSAVNLDAATKARIGFVPQRDELLEHYTGRRYLALIAGFYRGWNQGLVDRLCREWDIPIDKRTRELSVGQRQKLSILSAIGHEPDLIVLDEPVASLDPLARRQFLKELIALAESRERTILFSTHIVSDLERIASRVWLMKQGVIAVDAELDALKECTVRVQLPPGSAVPAGFGGDALLHARTEQHTPVLIFRDWSSALQRSLEQRLGHPLTPEGLSLEDIFLELHT